MCSHLSSLGDKVWLSVPVMDSPYFEQLETQGGVTPTDSIVTAATALSQWSTVKPPE